MSNDWSNGCIKCYEVPRIARDVQDLYDTMDYYRRLYRAVSEERDNLKQELKQLRKKEVTP